MKGALPYCFLLPELADPTRPLKTMSVLSVETLLNIDETVQGEAWKHFFLNVDQAVTFLCVASPEEVKMVVEAGSRWSGTGWDTTKCAKAV